MGERLQNGSPYAIASLSCVSVCHVTLVYCGQTVGWTKMPLVTEVGLSPGHIVLDGNPALPPPKRKAVAPTFMVYGRAAHVYRGQTAGCIRMPLGTEVGLSPYDIVLDGDPAPLMERGTAALPPPTFQPTLLWHDRPSQQLLSSCFLVTV